jgi:uncharacterized Rmd1/YagE family protein
MGALFSHWCDVNLNSDILDTPDIFWEWDEFEDEYDVCRKYLSISKRTSVLNQRLEILKTLYEMLQNEQNFHHGNRLEWIIIILIVLEVLLELFSVLVTYYKP